MKKLEIGMIIEFPDLGKRIRVIDFGKKETVVFCETSWKNMIDGSWTLFKKPVAGSFWYKDAILNAFREGRAIEIV